MRSRPGRTVHCGGDEDAVTTTTRLLEPTNLADLVRTKLRANPDGEYAPGRAPETELSADEYRAAVVQQVARQYQGKLEQWRSKPDPTLLSIKSWSYGIPHAEDRPALERMVEDAIFLRLEEYRAHFFTAEEWQAIEPGRTSARQWLEKGRAATARPMTAASSIAAARWLDASLESEAEALLKSRNPKLPQVMLNEPRRDYPDKKFAKRHWEAWDMKNYGRLKLPSLLLHEGDENFSIRTRMYRSIGQVGDLVGVYALREGTHDPHGFARAQAVRSLGWLGDPFSAERLRHLAKHDPSEEVRRTAALALERIAAFFLYFGQWRAIQHDPRRVLGMVRELCEHGLRAAAREWMAPLSDALLSEEECVRLWGELGLEEEDVDGLDDPQRCYAYWFKEAGALEQQIESTDPERTTDPMLRLYIYSRRGDRTQVEWMKELASQQDDLGWNARRALRRLRVPHGGGGEGQSLPR